MMQDYAASFQQIYRESNDIQYRDKADDLLSEIEYEISAYKLYKSQVIG
jgi:hypothetical protein